MSWVTTAARSTPVAAAARVSSSATRGSLAVRASTSPANTTAAAGAPPMTDANEPSTASTVMFGLSALEKTTNAPAVVPRDHAEDDRPVEVDDRPADLGAVLELH